MKTANIAISLLAIYAFLAPLGNMVRFGVEEGEIGLTSITLVALVTLFMRPALSIIYKEKLLFLVLLLCLWFGVASLMAKDVWESFTNSGILLLYLLLAGIGARYAKSPSHTAIILFAYCAGAFIGSSSTLIDYYGIVNLPRVNELEIATLTEDGYQVQASGPFARRTAMAAYYTIAISICIILPLTYTKMRNVYKMLLYLTALTSVVALLLTHNRGGLLGAVASIVIVLVATSKSTINIIKLATLLLLFSIALVVIVNAMSPDLFSVYATLLGTGGATSSQDIKRDESDYLRVIFFWHALTGIANNPIGNGYSLLTNVAGYNDVDPHGNINQIVWGAGMFGLMWIIAFMFMVIRYMRKGYRSRHYDQSAYSVMYALFGGLVSWFMLGLGHTILSTGVAWMFFGLLLGLNRSMNHHGLCLYGK